MHFHEETTNLFCPLFSYFKYLNYASFFYLRKLFTIAIY